MHRHKNRHMYCQRHTCGDQVGTYIYWRVTSHVVSYTYTYRCMLLHSRREWCNQKQKGSPFFNFGFACFCLQIMRPKPFHGFLVNWISSIGTSGRCRHTVASPSDAGDWDPLPSRAVSWLHVEGRCYSGSGAYPTLCWRWRSQYPHPNLSWIWNAWNAWNAKKKGSGGNTLHKAHFECSNT